MYEDDIFPPDQEGIFKGDLAYLQGINLTTSTTEDDVFMGGTCSLPVQWCPWHMEHLIVYTEKTLNMVNFNKHSFNSENSIKY